MKAFAAPSTIQCGCCDSFQELSDLQTIVQIESTYASFLKISLNMSLENLQMKIQNYFQLTN